MAEQLRVVGTKIHGKSHLMVRLEEGLSISAEKFDGGWMVTQVNQFDRKYLSQFDEAALLLADLFMNTQQERYSNLLRARVVVLERNLAA